MKTDQRNEKKPTYALGCLKGSAQETYERDLQKRKETYVFEEKSTYIREEISINYNAEKTWKEDLHEKVKNFFL